MTLHPASGIVFLIAVTNESNSSSLQPLYVCDIDRLFSAIRLNSVALDIPRSLAIQRDSRQSSIKCDRVSTDTVNRGRPRDPRWTSSVANVCSLSLSRWMREFRSASAVWMCSPTSTRSTTALNKTECWWQTNCNPSRSRGYLSKTWISWSCSLWKMSRFSDS